MPTQDERFTTLEQTVALLQKRSSSSIQDLNRNVTMLLGIASGQELGIKEIKIKLVTMGEQLDEHSTILNEHSVLLRQILERLPAK